MIDLRTNLLIIILNVNGLNSPNKTQIGRGDLKTKLTVEIGTIDPALF